MASPLVSVAIIHHKRAAREKSYLLHFLARLWKQQGIHMHYLYGTTEFVPADVAFLHIDLSVVPQDYASFAQRYPIALNATVLDIRKRRFSTLVLRHPKAYQREVIVKTDLNAGGRPESRLRRLAEPKLLYITRRAFRRFKLIMGWSAHSDRINSSWRYEIYPTSADVPAKIFRDPKLIVEKFVPERSGRWYCHRRYYFLGKAEVNQLWLGKKPICANDEDGIVKKTSDPPQELRDFRNEFGIDYGKIDYVLSENGEVIVFDINKTPYGTCRDPSNNPWLHQLCGDLHQGIFSFLKKGVISKVGAPGPLFNDNRHL